MKRLLVCILALVMLLSAAACEKDSISSSAVRVAAPVYPKGIAFKDYDKAHANREQNPVEDRTLEAINNFAYSTAAEVFKDIKANGCYSPVSLYYALALAASGAKGSTQAELLALLGFDDSELLSKECGNLYRLIYTDNEISKLKLANSLWLDDEVDGQKNEFKADFLDNAAKNFYASVFSVDFAHESAGEAMASWIKENTNGTLAPEFEPDPYQLMSIINTVYFYDEWVNRFNAERTKPDTFHLENGETVTCDFMNTTFASHGFYKGEGFTRSELALKASGSMIFILPDEGVAVSELLSSPEKIMELFSHEQSGSGEVVWSVPKLEYDSSYKLNETLKALGFYEAFGESADFTGITDSAAFISSVKQETHISIDENGVEASAFTKIDYVGSSMPTDKAEMILNRPFIYGITAANGTPLFVGVCMNPAA